MSRDLGVSLLIVGGGLVALGFLVLDSVPVFMLGVAVALLGVLAFWGGEYWRAYVDLAGSGWVNVAAVLEALGVASKAFYLPGGWTEFGVPVALVGSAPPPFKLPKALSVELSGGRALLLYTPGSAAAAQCVDVGGGLEERLGGCLVGRLALARGVLVLQEEGAYVVVVRGARRLEFYGNTLVRAVLGSPLASIVASVAAEALGTAVEVVGEERRGDSYIIRLRALGNA